MYEYSIQAARRCWPFVLGAMLLANGAIASPEPEQSRGAELLAPYKQGLQEALRSGLSESAIAAIGACQIQAPNIAQSLSHDGVRVGRASDRLRNPANVAPDWVEPIMQGYMADPSDRKPKSVRLSEDKVGYAEPIVLQPLCTVCHGGAIAEPVASRINELYPEDRAVGFKAGDLRGVFWVEYPSQL